MKPGTLEYWAEQGWQLDPLIAHGLGEITHAGSGPYYVGHERELGCDGHGKPMMPSRFAMGMRIGRQLHSSEILRFISDDKKDLRLSNVVFHSKKATSAELLKANGKPVLGYSHCLCGCGTELDLEIQVLQPYAYTAGHRPKSRNDPGNRNRARRPKANVLIEKVKEDEPMPPTRLFPKPEAKVIDDPLKEYRALFERMIHNLPWEEFKQLLTQLLEIHAGKGKP